VKYLPDKQRIFCYINTIMVTKRICVLGLVLTGLIAAGCGNVMIPTPPYTAPDSDRAADDPDGIVHVTGVSVDYSAIALAPGQTMQLGYSISPGNADNQNVLWSSDNYGVATVDSAGMVTALSIGNALITVISADGGKIAACGVEVTGLAGIINFHTDLTNDQVSLTWTNPTTPAFESVILNSVPAAPGLPLTIPGYAPAGHTITGLAYGTEYAISIRAHYSNGSESGATVKNVKPLRSVINSPSDTISLDALAGVPGFTADTLSVPQVITAAPAYGYISGTLPTGFATVHQKWWRYNGGLNTTPYPSGVTFEAGRQYCVTLTIAAAPGYNFEECGSTTFTHSGASSITNVTYSANRLTVTLEIRFSELPRAEISGIVYASDGTTPVALASVWWRQPGSMHYSGPVTSGFNGSYTISNLQGGTYTIHAFYGVNSETLGPLTITTDNLPGQNITLGRQKVTELVLDGVLTGPAPGAAPVTSVTLTGPMQAQYTAGNAEWSKVSGPGDAHQFAPGAVYKAVFTLTAAAGYTFSGIAANTFTYAGATVTHSAGGAEPLEITVTYPAVPAWADVDVNTASGQTTLAQNLQWIRDNGEPGKNYIITVIGNESIGTQNLSVTSNYNLVNTRITLKGNGTPRTISLSGSGSLFTVRGFNESSKISLVLDENITLEGWGSGVTNTAPLVFVSKYAELVMKDGSAVKKNEASGNIGGGVSITDNSVFTMSGGTISDNKTTSVSFGGGGVYIGNSVFTMTGGTISGNTASGNGGGVHIIGSTSSTSVFTMSEGTISDNVASSGGGVSINNYSVFTMSGGTISGNEANGTGGVGGGVLLMADGSTFSKSGTSVIYGDSDHSHTTPPDENTAASLGNAVYCADGRKRDNDAPAGQNISTTLLGPSGGWE
jgi:hypothetical protein